MSTPTPRTDARLMVVTDNDTCKIKVLETVHASFVRILEREVNALTAERDQLRAELAAAKEKLRTEAVDDYSSIKELQRELCTEREKVRLLKLDKDRLDWWNGESYYQFGKSHKCMNLGWWWSCGFDQIQGKSGIKNIRDAIDSAMAHSKSGRNKYNVCKRIEKSETEGTK